MQLKTRKLIRIFPWHLFYLNSYIYIYIYILKEYISRCFMGDVQWCTIFIVDFWLVNIILAPTAISTLIWNFQTVSLTACATYYSPAYIYIYIYCHPQRDCFFVSQLFTVTRHIARFILGSKPAYFYGRPITYHSAISLTYVSSGIKRIFFQLCLHFAQLEIGVFNSLEELCITWVAAVNSFARVLKQGIQSA